MVDGISIPEDWLPFISCNFNRVFVNPASGCRANCAYCYIFDYGHPHTPQLFEASGGEVKRWLQSQNGFREGKCGTLISIGATCDPFDEEVVYKTLEFVEAFSPMRNPIQLSTKYYVSETAAEQLCGFQVESGQIILFGTITSFRYWHNLEPGTHEPHRRLLGLTNAMLRGISTCLYVKPVLPGITDKEASLFAQAILEHNIPYCTLGLAYINDKTLSRIRQRGLPIRELTKRGKSPPPPSKASETKVYARATGTLDTVELIKPILEVEGTECVVSAPCVHALAYGILCPTGVWHYHPELCVHCRAECSKRLTSTSAQVRDFFIG